MLLLILLSIGIKPIKAQEVLLPKKVALFYYEEHLQAERLRDSVVALRARLEKEKAIRMLHQQLIKSYKYDSIQTRDIIMTLEEMNDINEARVEGMKREIRKSRRKSLLITVLNSIAIAVAIITIN